MDGGDCFPRDEVRQVRWIAVPAGPGDHERCAREQRPEELPCRDVEARRCLLQHAVAGFQPVLRLHPAQPVDDGGVGHHDALGPARGSRRVDDIGRVRWVQGRGRQGAGRRWRLDAGLRLRGIDDEARNAAIEAPGEFLRGHEAHGLRVVQHEGEPVGGKVRVDRQVRRPASQDRDEGRHQLQRPWDRQRDDAFRACAHGRQAVGPIQGLAVEFAPGHGAAFEAQRDRAGIARQAGIQQFGEVGRGLRADRAAASGQEGLAFICGDDLHAADGLRGTIRQGVEHAEQPGLVRRQFGRGVEIGMGVEIDPQVLAVTAFIHEDAEVAEGAVGEIADLGVAVAEAQCVVERLHVDHGGEEFVVLRLQFQIGAQPLVTVGLVAQDLAHLLADLAQQGREGHFGPHGQAQGHRVGDHARYAPHAVVVARRHGNADHQVGNPCHPVQIGGRRRDQDLRQRAAVQCGRIAQRGDARRRPVCRVPQQSADVVAAPFGEGQRLGAVTHPLHPVFAVFQGTRGVAIGLVLLDQDGQRFQFRIRGRSRAVHQRRVQVCRPARENDGGEAVEGVVVSALIPDVVVRSDAEHRAGPHGLPLDVHAAGGFVGHPLLGRGPGIAVAAEIEHRDAARELCFEPLPRALGRVRDTQADGIGFCAQGAQGLQQQPGLEAPVDLDGLREIEVGLGRREACTEPHAHLGRGQWKGLDGEMAGAHGCSVRLVDNDGMGRRTGRPPRAWARDGGPLVQPRTTRQGMHPQASDDRVRRDGPPSLLWPLQRLFAGMSPRLLRLSVQCCNFLSLVGIVDKKLSSINVPTFMAGIRGSPLLCLRKDAKSSGNGDGLSPPQGITMPPCRRKPRATAPSPPRVRYGATRVPRAWALR